MPTTALARRAPTAINYLLPLACWAWLNGIVLTKALGMRHKAFAEFSERRSAN